MLKLLLGGMMLVLTAGFGLVAWFSLQPIAPTVQAAEAAAPTALVTILAAARAMQAGGLLRPEDIGKTEIAAGTPMEGVLLDTPVHRAELVGAMIRRSLVALQPISTADILRPGDGGFLAAVLAPNHRAVSVAVDAVSGTAGLIWPGDRVDLILTQVSDDPSATAGRRTFGETVLRDVRVIAVDQQLSRGTSPDPAVAGQSNRTVTLEVLPDAAERVAVAVRLGRVALTVRAAEPVRTAEPGAGAGAVAGAVAAPAAAAVVTAATPGLPPIPTTWGQDVSPALNQRRSPSTGATVRVFQGSGADKEFKFE